MLNKINDFNLEELILYENIFPLYKTNNPYFDMEFQSRIEKFKTYNEFFSNYSNFSITFLDNFLTEVDGKINIFTELLTKNDFPEKNEKDTYFTIITNVVLMNFLYLRLNTYINNIYVQLKDFIHSTLKQSKNNELHYKLNEYLQSIAQSPDFFERKDIVTYTRVSTKNDTASFRPQEFMNIITQKISPKSELEVNDTINNNINSNILIDSFPKNNEIDTPCFHKQEKRFNSPEQKRPKSHFLKEFSPKRKNTNDSNSNITPSNSTKNIVSFTSLIIDNNNNENDNNIISKNKPLVSLLAICTEMYKKNLITFEEKCQLKKLIIGKDQKIFDMFEKCNVKDSLFTQIKSYLKEFF